MSISKLGVNNTLSRDEIRGVVLSNQVSLLGLIFGLILSVLHGIFVGWGNITYSIGLIGILFVIPLVANYQNKNLISRLFLSFYLPSSIIIASIYVKITSTGSLLDFETQYYDFRFFLMICGIVAIVLYEKGSRIWSYISLVYVTILLMAFDPLHNYFGVGYYQTGHQDPTYYFTNVVVLLAFIGQNAGLFVLRFSIDKNEEELLSEIEVRKEAERDSRIAKEQAIKANSTKSEFLANVSHEIRTPLNGVIGFSDLLMKTSLDKSQAKYMTVLNNSALSLLDIVNEILDFSKIETGKLELKIERTDIHEIGKQVTESLQLVSKENKLDLSLHISSETPQFVQADPIRLQQVLMNLLGNAVKFTEIGEISLSIEPTSIEKGKQVTLRFTVTDTGIGIDEENQQKIFDAFVQGDGTYTKKYGGTGLGLTISSRLLALMNSKLLVDSKVGKGSTFHFECSFPLAE